MRGERASGSVVRNVAGTAIAQARGGQGSEREEGEAAVRTWRRNGCVGYGRVGVRALVCWSCEGGGSAWQPEVATTGPPGHPSSTHAEQAWQVREPQPPTRSQGAVARMPDKTSQELLGTHPPACRVCPTPLEW